MSEGHTYRCSWSLTTTGYRLWVVADPELVREDAAFAEAAQELSYAILDKTGDGEAQLEFEPPPPGTELRPPALLRLWELGLQDTVRFSNARECFERGLCDNCLMPLGPRTHAPLEVVAPLPKSHLLNAQMADAGVGVGPKPRIFSPTVVAMLTDEERVCFEWRPVRVADRETKYLELVHRIPPTPQVAPLGATARHSRCETCGFTYVYVEQVGNEPNRFMSTRDLPAPLPPALAMGMVSDSGLLISDARRREMLAQKGSRWLTTVPVSVIPEPLVDRAPLYLPWPRARRKE
jgi:hypothetical protein